MYFSSKSKGFTLIEILVSMGIIGLLSAVVMANLNNARIRSRDQARVSAVKQVQIALALYFDDNRNYPGNHGASVGWYHMGCDDNDNPQDGTGTEGDFDDIITPYMAEGPTSIGGICIYYRLKDDAGTGYRVLFSPEGDPPLDIDQNCYSPGGYYCVHENYPGS